MTRRARVHPLRSPRSGFTLIELLVVVAIIALLISILIPSLALAREQARRTVCGAQMRSYVTAIVLYADESNDALMDPGNFTGMFNEYVLKYPDYLKYHPQQNGAYSDNFQRFHPAVREILVNKYGLQRKFFYCPSNPELNEDWWWFPRPEPGLQYTDTYGFPITGYILWAGRREFAVRTPRTPTNSGYARAQELWSRMHSKAAYDFPIARMYSSKSFGFETVPAGKQLFKRRLSDVTYFQVAVSDMSYSRNERFGLEYERGYMAPNHLGAHDEVREAPGYVPKGTKGGMNVGFLDGSVTWKPARELGQYRPDGGEGARFGVRAGYNTGYRWIDIQVGTSHFKWYW